MLYDSFSFLCAYLLLFHVAILCCLPSQGALVGLYADKRYKSGDDDKKDLPLQSIEIIGGEVLVICTSLVCAKQCRDPANQYL